MRSYLSLDASVAHTGGVTDSTIGDRTVDGRPDGQETVVLAGWNLLQVVSGRAVPFDRYGRLVSVSILVGLVFRSTLP